MAGKSSKIQQRLQRAMGILEESAFSNYFNEKQSNESQEDKKKARIKRILRWQDKIKNPDLLRDIEYTLKQSQNIESEEDMPDPLRQSLSRQVESLARVANDLKENGLVLARLLEEERNTSRRLREKLNFCWEILN